MLIAMVDSTIAAVATPAGTGGISIIKISGPNALPIASSIFKPAPKRRPDTRVPSGLESHRLYYGHIVDDRSGRNLDEVLLAVMKAREATLVKTWLRSTAMEARCRSGPFWIWCCAAGRGWPNRESSPVGPFKRPH